MRFILSQGRWRWRAPAPRGTTSMPEQLGVVLVWPRSSAEPVALRHSMHCQRLYCSTSFQLVVASASLRRPAAPSGACRRVAAAGLAQPVAGRQANAPG